MRFVVRLAPLVCLVAGCGFAQKPYANDPLLRGGRGVWTAHEANPPAEPPAPAQLEPLKPAAVVTSRPRRSE